MIHKQLKQLHDLMAENKAITSRLRARLTELQSQAFQTADELHDIAVIEAGLANFVRLAQECERFEAQINMELN